MLAKISGVKLHCTQNRDLYLFRTITMQSKVALCQQEFVFFFWCTSLSNILDTMMDNHFVWCYYALPPTKCLHCYTVLHSELLYC